MHGTRFISTQFLPQCGPTLVYAENVTAVTAGVITALLKKSSVPPFRKLPAEGMEFLTLSWLKSGLGLF